MHTTMTAVAEHEGTGGIATGTRVDVRDRFLGSWTHGFEVVERTLEGYKLRRVSDGSVLPTVFALDDVREERKRRGLWWY